MKQTIAGSSRLMASGGGGGGGGGGLLRVYEALVWGRGTLSGCGCSHAGRAGVEWLGGLTSSRQNFFNIRPSIWSTMGYI